MSIQLQKPEDIKAKFKIEIMFDPHRTTQGPNLYLITIWDTSGSLSADGDVLLHFCPDCPNSILQLQGDVQFCPSCRKPIPEGKTQDTKVCRTLTSTLAEKLETLFHKLQDQVDIVVKYHKKDIRYTMKTFSGKKLDQSRAQRNISVYSLRRILQDTQQGGAPLRDRLYAFLTA